MAHEGRVELSGVRQHVANVHEYISSGVQGCCTSDASIQFNAPVANKILYRFNICSCKHSNDETLASRNVQLLATAMDSRAGRRDDLTPSPGGSQANYIRVQSLAKRTPSSLVVVNDANIEYNWISDRMVETMGLTTFESRKRRNLHRNGRHHESTGLFVSFERSKAAQGRKSRHRFHIVEDVGFDILLGADILGIQIGNMK